MIHVDEDDPIGELEPAFVQRDVVIKRGVDAEDFYELLTEIGRGKFGTVYHCREKTTGLELAAKFVSVSRREDRRNAEREVDIMRQLRHPRLIQLYDAFDTGKLLCVVLELITGGELFERVIDDDFILTEKACTVFMRQICEGIEFVHQQNILHLDMKPENILCLTKTGNRVKIIDFGLARKYDPTKKLQVLFGTPEFVAPEVVNFDQIGFGTDMWSIGVICYVLLSGLSPFMGETDVETMANVTVAKYDFDDEAFNEISEDAKDFIKQLLVKDKMGRLTAQQCVAHKWLRKRPPPPPKPVTEPPELKRALIETPKNEHAEELDVAKDNLRLFVERWSEHPNSPYLFDVSTHEITPCMSLNNCLDRSSSKQSLGGCSPSPCGSINSSPDSVIESEDSHVRHNGGSQEYDDNHKLLYSPSFHSLERRASDSSCLNNKKPDICVRVNLAEEIKKLSEHLYMLSTMNTDLVNNNIQNSSGTAINHEATDVTEKLPNAFLNTSSVKANSSISNGMVNSTASTESSMSALKTFNGSNSTTTLKNDTKTVIKDTKNSPVNISNKFISSKLTETSQESNAKDSTPRLNGFASRSASSSRIANSNYVDNDDGGMYNNLPWTRRKFKITNSSRDVPLSPTETRNSIFGVEFNKRRERIDKFVNSNGNGENSKSRNTIPRPFYKKTNENGDVKTNANNTKDLLLHLLDQWDESQSPPANFHNGRHKSVSMEWSEAEKLASKSMSTLNTFFSRQSSTSTTVKKKQESLASNGES